MTEITFIPNLAAEQLAKAQASTAGRAAQTIVNAPDAKLRQTVLALAAGHALGDHESPGEATLHVLQGHVRLRAGGEEWDLEAGEHMSIPRERHDLSAIEDAVVLLTVVGVRE